MQAHTTRSSLVRFAKSGMTELSCHPEVPEARQHIRHWWSLACHPEALAEGAHKMRPRPRISNTRKLVPSKKAAFTLAEVLITLAIIGIVAAMTIPTLIADYQKKATATKVKKVYAELTQIIRLSEVDNGAMNIWNFGNPEDGSDLPSAESSIAAVEKYIVPYYKNIKKCSVGIDDYTCGKPVSRVGVNYFLSSGAGLSVVTDYKGKNVYFVVTVNNIGSENLRDGRDWFMFIAHDGKVVPAGWHDGISREEILEGGILGNILGSESNVLFSCKESEAINEGDNDFKEYTRRACTALLMIDNWEFKDDYGKNSLSPVFVL